MMMGRWIGDGYGYGIHGGWAMGFGMLLNLIFWGALIYFAIRFFRNHRTGGCCDGGHGEQDSPANPVQKANLNPEEIVRERYARGEINQEQYREMLETLKKEARE